MCHTSIGDIIIYQYVSVAMTNIRSEGGGAFPASMAHRDEVSIRTKLESAKRLVEEAEAEAIAFARRLLDEAEAEAIARRQGNRYDPKNPDFYDPELLRARSRTPRRE